MTAANLLPSATIFCFPRKARRSLAWWCMPVILALGGWRQEDQEEFKAILIDPK